MTSTTTTTTRRKKKTENTFVLLSRNVQVFMFRIAHLFQRSIVFCFRFICCVSWCFACTTFIVVLHLRWQWSYFEQLQTYDTLKIANHRHEKNHKESICFSYQPCTRDGKKKHPSTQPQPQHPIFRFVFYFNCFFSAVIVATIRFSFLSNVFVCVDAIKLNSIGFLLTAVGPLGSQRCLQAI